MYGIPSEVRRVANFNVYTQKFIYIGDDYSCRFKLEGGVEGMDDNIYVVPYLHYKWLKIDISTNTTSVIGDDLSKYEKYKDTGCV